MPVVTDQIRSSGSFQICGLGLSSDRCRSHATFTTVLYSYTMENPMDEALFWVFHKLSKTIAGSNPSALKIQGESFLCPDELIFKAARVYGCSFGALQAHVLGLTCSSTALPSFDQITRGLEKYNTLHEQYPTTFPSYSDVGMWSATRFSTCSLLTSFSQHSIKDPRADLTSRLPSWLPVAHENGCSCGCEYYLPFLGVIIRDRKLIPVAECDPQRMM